MSDLNRTPLQAQDMCLMSRDQFTQYWEEIQRRLQLTPEFYDYFNDQWLIQEVMKEHVQVWTIGTDVAVLTQIAVYPQCKALHCFWAQGSDIDKYLTLGWEVFHTFAKMAGCTRITLSGRAGWGRKLRKFGKITEECIVFSTPVIDYRSS